MDKRCYIHTGEYYTAVNMRGSEKHAARELNVGVSIDDNCVTNFSELSGLNNHCLFTIRWAGI